METKHFIGIGVFVGSSIGGYLGSLIDKTGLGLWSILLAGVGGILGVWAGYKIGNNL